MNRKDLSKKIEKLRDRLVLTAIKEPLSSPKIQHMSRRLDKLLNKYEQLIR